MKQSAAPPKSSFLASYLIIAILAMLPFYTLLTTWGGSNFGHLDLFRIIKEILMVPLGLYAAVVVYKNPRIYQLWRQSWLVGLILVYTLLFIGFSGLVLVRHSVAPSAVIYSLITNLRFLWFMLMVWTVASVNPLLKKHWLKVVTIPASLAIIFGLLQRFLLPADFLRHFGYGPTTIDAIETVDQKLSFRRIQSGLRGANPFGAYLVVVITAALAYSRKRTWLKYLVVGGLLALFLTFSRSAWLGLAVSVVVLVWQMLPNQRLRRGLLIVTVILMILAGGLVALLKDNDSFQNTVFHSDGTTGAVSSNSQRASALRTGWNDIIDQPLGRGPGTAGPASVRNDGQARIAENYFLQIGQEIGWLGLGLFVAINLLVAWALAAQKTLLSKALLASLVGLTLINMLSHAWVDDSLSLLWWGLAGVSLASPAILKNNHELKAKTKKIATT